MRWYVVRRHSVAWLRWMIGAVGRLELSVLAAAAAVSIGTWGFIEIADEVVEGEAQKLDERIMLAMRRADDPALPLGPEWLHDAAVDITALGGQSVLLLVTLAVAGFILLKRRYGALLLVVFAAGGAGLLNSVLKAVFSRQRPSIVHKLVDVTSLSFPSGHAMASAAIYLSLGVLLAGLTSRRRDRLYILAVAVCLTGIVGISRVYLGVHYPTDVLAGWSAGVAWATLCWLVIRFAPSVLRARGAVNDTAPPEAQSET